jgi:hypothetical protein
MSSSKKNYLQRDFPASVYLSEAQNPILPLPPYKLQIVYKILIHQVRGEGQRVEPERREKSINSVKHLPQSTFTDQFF